MIRHFLSVLGFGAMWVSTSGATLGLEKLRTEYLGRPFGLDALQPRLSWIVTSTPRAAKQTAYQILAAATEVALASGHGDGWDSGKVGSDAAAQIVYAGAPLASGQRIWWKVRAWDGAGEVSAWSAPGFWEMGLLAKSEWYGKWIGRSAFTGESQPLPLLRRSFALANEIKRARLYVTGLGYFELIINDRRVGDHLLDPGYTRYDRRVLYVTHDVTDLHRRGDKVLGVMLGNGWFNRQALIAVGSGTSVFSVR